MSCMARYRPILLLILFGWLAPRVDAAFPGMGLRQAEDAGATEDGSLYRLVWETLDANRDLPRPAPWPAPSVLRLVRGELPK